MTLAKYILPFALIVLSTHRSTPSDRYSDRLFDTRCEITYKTAESIGFERIWGIDVHMYTKQENDTIIELLYDSLDGFPETKTWKIRLDSVEKRYVSNFLLDKGAVRLVPIASYEVDDTYFFTIRYYFNGHIYTCMVGTEDESHFLYITYHRPSKK